MLAIVPRVEYSFSKEKQQTGKSQKQNKICTYNCMDIDIIEMITESIKIKREHENF